MSSVLVIDDHKIVANGTKELLQKAGFDADMLFTANQIDEIMKKKKYDVFLVDWNMPGTNGLKVTEQITGIDSEAKIIIYTGYETEMLAVFDELIEKGVQGIISKSVSIDTLQASVQAVIGNQSVFPYSMFRNVRSRKRMRKKAEALFDARELEIIKGIVDGKTNRTIAEVLYADTRTIEYQIQKIYHKLSIHSRKEVNRKVKELGIILN